MCTGNWGKVFGFEIWFWFWNMISPIRLSARLMPVRCGAVSLVQLRVGRAGAGHDRLRESRNVLHGTK